MKNMKHIALVVAITLLLGCAIGGTLAWLMDTSDTVTNTFSTSTIGVELKEHTYNAENGTLNSETTESGVSNYKMVPGWTIPKDPEAWITDGSEAAILFVQVEESQNFDTFMTYAIADGWILLTDNTKTGSNIVTDDTTPDSYVIYREVAKGVTASAMDTADKTFAILAGDKVFVKGEVTKEMMTATGFTEPTLTFKAYAHQLFKTNDTTAENGGKFTAAEAWENVKPTQG